jgi:hypothetical protein
MFLMVSDLLLLFGIREGGDGPRWAGGSAGSLETISAETSRVHVCDEYSQSHLLLHLEALSVGGHQGDGTVVVSHLAVFSKSVDLGRMGSPGEHFSGRERAAEGTREGR